MRILTSIVFFAASPAMADCPTAADLTTGIKITESDGSLNLFTTTGDDLVTNDGTAPDGYTYRNVLARGTHLVEFGDTENGSYIEGSRRIVDYGIPPSEMPTPAPNSNWEADTIVDNGAKYAEFQSQSWGAQSTFTIGDCTYDMIPGKITYTNSDYIVFEGLHYLPALGLGLLHSYQIQGEPASKYIASEIEAVQ